MHDLVAEEAGTESDGRSRQQRGGREGTSQFHTLSSFPRTLFPERAARGAGRAKPLSDRTKDSGGKRDGN